jgi:uncharacterized protein HemX
MYYKTRIIVLSIFVILLGIVIYKHFQLTAANKNQAQQLAELKTKQQQLADLKENNSSWRTKAKQQQLAELEQATATPRSSKAKSSHRKRTTNRVVCKHKNSTVISAVFFW